MKNPQQKHQTDNTFFHRGHSLRCLLVFCYSLISLGLFAQQSTKLIQISKERLTTENGLANNNIRNILQDQRGFLWLGTEEGLQRYDGHSFKLFSKRPNSLRDNRIKTLYQNNSGQIWVGTVSGGLHLYHPSLESFQSWTSDSLAESRLSSTGVSAITEDAEGTLWIATMGSGLYALQPEAGQLSHYRHSADNTNSLSNDYVRALYVDAENRLWIGSDAGLDRFLPEENAFRKQNFPEPAGNRSGRAVGVIAGNSSGNLFLGTPFGLVSYDPAGGSSHLWQPAPAANDGYETNRVTAIADHTENLLWVGTLSQGLFLLEKNNLRPIKLQETAPANVQTSYATNAIIQDNGGITWVGTINGLEKILPETSRFRNWQQLTNATLSSNYIWPIYQDRTGVIWIGTIGGLNAFDPATGEVTQYLHDPKNPKSLGDNSVIAIYEDSYHDLWIGTFTGGLNRLNRSNDTFDHWRHHPDHPSSLPHNLTSAIYEDRSGQLWIGTAKGLATFDRDAGQVIRARISDASAVMQDRYISDMYEDRQGNFWVTTLRSGLHLLDRGSGTSRQWMHDPNDPQSVSANALGDILALPHPADSNRTILWLGSEGGGLIRFDPGEESFRSFSSADGLSDNSITSMVADDENILWLATAKGLTRFDPKNESARIYDQRDGISNAEFNPWAGMKSQSGELWFGTPNGITLFDPRTFSSEESPKPPTVIFTELAIFNQTVAVGEKNILSSAISETETIRLSHQDHIFSISFAALDFTRPEQNRYAYILEGLHNEWIDLGNRHQISFTGLSPGSYRLRVKAANSAGVWNETGISLKLIITPPFWRSNWAYLLYVILLGAALLAYRQYDRRKQERETAEKIRQAREAADLREAQLRAEAAESRTKALQAAQETEKQQIRMRIASDLHDEIGSNLSSIALISNLLQKTPDLSADVQEAFQDVNRAARDSTEAIRDIVWFINPKSDSIGDLITRMKETARTMLQQIDYDFNDAVGETAQKLPPEAKRNIYLIFKEILNNIIRHARAKQVNITVAAKGDLLTVSIQDDGIGFAPASDSSGNGLQNMRYRAEQIGGKIRIDSSPGKGAQLHFSLKIT